MRIYFKGESKKIFTQIKKIIPRIKLRLNGGVIEASGFRKGFISNYLPRILALEGVLRVKTEFDEIAPLSATKSFYFKKPFDSYKRFIIAGPCVIDDFDLFEKTLLELKSLGIDIIRTPLFKPRSSPYTWEGFGLEGVARLKEIKKRYSFISVMEILDCRVIDKVLDLCDVIQIGARNMRNYTLLKEVGLTKKPVLLKRHPYATLKELILSVEYLARYGSRKIIICERGDSFSEGVPSINIQIIKQIKRLFKIPVVADVSHSGKKVEKAFEFALKTIRYADGLMVETSLKPSLSPIDTKQVMSIDDFKRLLSMI